MRNRFSFLFAGFLLLSTLTSLADVLHLKGGRKVGGTFLGGDSRTVRFLRHDGQVRSYTIADVQRIVFGNHPVFTPPASSSSSHSTVPKDTDVVVRMIDSINSDVNKPGETFRATVEKAVTAGGRVLVPEGADAAVQLVHVKQSGKLRGREEIALQLRSITFKDKTYSVTSRFAAKASEGKGKQTAKVVGGTAAIGALIGALAKGKKGAAIGAATGAGAGAAIQAVRGKRVRVPSEALLSFTLEEPLTLRAAR
ncbi:hypothetical protein MYX75_10910 [Acidobacteria bacterium AH-259-A15]|nr:hypothetical protein [Acidobacteria bacterium AH-259-A15]